MVIPGQVGHAAGERLGSLAKVLIVNGDVISICTNTSKKLVGIPTPERSKIANENASGVDGSTFVVKSSRKRNGSLALGMKP